MIVAGVDGRTHHLHFGDLEFTGDASPGAIVEARAYDDANGRRRLSLATRSDLLTADQVAASGATWLDRQLLAKDPPLSGAGFGAEMRAAMDARADHLIEEGLARRQGQPRSGSCCSVCLSICRPPSSGGGSGSTPMRTTSS